MEERQMKLLGYMNIFLGGAVSALNLATMFSNTEYNATWWKLLLSFGIAGLGVFILEIIEER